MNTKPSSTKSLIWMLLIIGAVILGYVYFQSNATPSSSDSLAATDISQTEIGTHVLSLLNQIQSLNIDASFFKDPGFNTLVDYSVAIPPVPVGRPNPFAPLPGYSVSQTAAARNAR